MTMRSHIPRPAPCLTQKTNCAECGRKRSSGNHELCSQIRQAKFAEENGARRGR